MAWCGLWTTHCTFLYLRSWEKQLVSAQCVIQTVKTNPWWGASTLTHSEETTHTHGLPAGDLIRLCWKVVLCHVKKHPRVSLVFLSQAGHCCDCLLVSTSLDWLSRDKTLEWAGPARLHLEPPETGTAAPSPGWLRLTHPALETVCCVLCVVSLETFCKHQ